MLDLVSLPQVLRMSTKCCFMNLVNVGLAPFTYPSFPASVGTRKVSFSIESVKFSAQTAVNILPSRDEIPPR